MNYGKSLKSIDTATRSKPLAPGMGEDNFDVWSLIFRSPSPNERHSNSNCNDMTRNDEAPKSVWLLVRLGLRGLQ